MLDTLKPELRFGVFSEEFDRLSVSARIDDLNVLDESLREFSIGDKDSFHHSNPTAVVRFFETLEYIDIHSPPYLCSQLEVESSLRKSRGRGVERFMFALS